MLGAIEALTLIQRGELSSQELVESYLERIQTYDQFIHAWEWLEPGKVIDQAKKIDAQIQKRQKTEPLNGIPIGIKDIFNTKEYPTQMGSQLWKGFRPGNDARVVDRLKKRGGIVMGKTVTAEFAVHSPGPTVNPHDFNRSPGTSSSGSAAAVAAHMIPLAIGTQTAGSTIRPSSYCGIFGYKPSFGVVPRTGILKTLDTLDHVCFLGRNIEDIKLIFEQSRVSGRNHPYVHANLDKFHESSIPKTWKVALIEGPKWGEAENYAQDALISFAKKLEGSPDIRIEHIRLPAIFNKIHAVHNKIYSKMLSYYFSEEAQSPEFVSDSFIEMVNYGKTISLEEYRKGLEFQAKVQKEISQIGDKYDILLDLSTGGEAMIGLDTIDRPDNCLVWTFCHVPTMSLPIFKSPSGLPFGAQVISNKYNDYLIFEFGKVLSDQELIVNAPYPLLDELMGIS